MADIERLKDFLKKVVQNHENETGPDLTLKTKTRKSNPDVRDVTDMYLMEAARTTIGGKVAINEDEIWRAMFDILGAGTETTSETLLWGILHMCLKPEVQTRVNILYIFTGILLLLLLFVCLFYSVYNVYL